ncbi:hypothetical protein [Polaribacter ponticola]|uniref:Uncharacterized protein n=1 Tax=Polaribacter ponticola TaxID=2978475 RepID=A0ABT5SC96_9FLAO|nr:hypothetical protein [Polaribacter sp. MSW5]MDD7915439.1 hypothetical protein [Polaribacter sp. MSW5]
MNFQLSTYRTLSGITEVLEIPRKKETQWIIYQDNKPKFFVDFFDLESESNTMMNSLVLCAKKISRLGLKKKIKSEIKVLFLDPLPEEWLAYSM